MAWTDYSSAPVAGTELCRLDQIEGVLSLTVESEKGAFPMLVARFGEGVRAYVNACPHQFLPLDYHGNQILSADGTRLLCTAHGASFDIDTGAPFEGADCELDAVPVEIVDGVVRIAA